MCVLVVAKKALAALVDCNGFIGALFKSHFLHIYVYHERWIFTNFIFATLLTWNRPNGICGRQLLSALLSYLFCIKKEWVLIFVNMLVRGYMCVFKKTLIQFLLNFIGVADYTFLLLFCHLRALVVALCKFVLLLLLQQVYLHNFPKLPVLLLCFWCNIMRKSFMFSYLHSILLLEWEREERKILIFIWIWKRFGFAAQY